jgi:hypothetical protein
MSGKRSTKPSQSANPKTVREPANAIPDDQLLFTREQVMRMLGGISYPTVIRLEVAGKLPPVKLKPGKLGKTFYRRADVMALVEG